ncbi:MAG: hypothetical protein B6D39_08550 [Anaerolineae bacterium UTCFX2]|jgi:quinol-cytochrome oxidoreductase complex cytochrome b subunit|nr:cytochrome b N-terminal domain-containing protein [Anaerolineales bacterium]OQY90117.1 MAG: hypothetical protein B6D39_08550 [Anaerolineae bacterium UTCFX2]
MRPSFFQHLHPPTIPAPQARLRYTLGAGGLSLFLLLVVILTGVLEMFYYIPTPERAALSIQEISFLVPFGGLIRNLHFWSAQFLVVFSLLHLLRVILTGAYAPPRRVNYLIGISLLALILALDFSGYVLRWDNGVYWALVTGTNLIKTIPGAGPALYSLAVGGNELGAPTLVRFYAWHIFGLALTMSFLAGWHIFRVRRDGGIAVPPPELRADPSRITRAELVRRETAAALLVSAFLLALAVLYPAPIAAPLRDLTDQAFETRAPWFFLWVQQLVRLGDPFVFGVLIPGGLFLLLAFLPFLFKPPAQAELGRWFPPSGRPAQITAGLIVIIIAVLSLIAVMQNPA